MIKYVNLIIDHIIANGNIKDNAVLMEEPFRSLGSLTVLFKDDLGKAKEIMNVVADIKSNSEIMAWLESAKKRGRWSERRIERWADR